VGTYLLRTLVMEPGWARGDAIGQVLDCFADSPLTPAAAIRYLIELPRLAPLTQAIRGGLEDGTFMCMDAERVAALGQVHAGAVVISATLLCLPGMTGVIKGALAHRGIPI